MRTDWAKDVKIVSNAIEFRDVVMSMDREGLQIFARPHGSEWGPAYRILARHADPFQKITTADLFMSNLAPVYMEDVAQALTADGDKAPRLDVFTR